MLSERMCRYSRHKVDLADRLIDRIMLVLARLNQLGVSSGHPQRDKMGPQEAQGQTKDLGTPSRSYLARPWMALSFYDEIALTSTIKHAMALSPS